jgi:hypothetical protein
LVLLPQGLAFRAARLSVVGFTRAYRRNEVPSIPRSSASSSQADTNCRGYGHSYLPCRDDVPGCANSATMITVLIVIIFFVAVLAWARANAHIVHSGIPGGRIVLQDTARQRPLARPLVSRRYGFIGKPDYLVETADGLIPVEVKSRPYPETGPRVADAAHDLLRSGRRQIPDASTARDHCVCRSIRLGPIHTAAARNRFESRERDRRSSSVCSASQPSATRPLQAMRIPIGLRRSAVAPDPPTGRTKGESW